ncbi:MAG: glycosyltransferase family 2 protein [Candidatus Eisenbacteria bacterium]|nr:glycosyltransferase family 2 protein [Candidatus Eisenbacteria bacterium]
MAGELPISVLLLARDETRDLEELLPTLAFAREVVVVWDPRGERATRDAAERLGARVHERRFEGFGPQRRHALEQCTQDWVLWLDADERLTGESLPTLRRLTALPADRSLVAARRRTWFLGRRIRWCGWGDEWLPRLFGRRAASFDDATVHEQVRIGNARVLRAPGPFEIEHHSYRTLEDCFLKMRRYASAGAEQDWARGRRAGALDLLLRPPLRFARQYVAQLGFLDGVHGLVLCGFAAAQVFLKYAALWDRGRREGRR